jgi:hypothetical protein
VPAFPELRGKMPFDSRRMPRACERIIQDLEQEIASMRKKALAVHTEYMGRIGYLLDSGTQSKEARDLLQEGANSLEEQREILSRLRELSMALENCTTSDAMLIELQQKIERSNERLTAIEQQLSELEIKTTKFDSHATRVLVDAIPNGKMRALVQRGNDTAQVNEQIKGMEQELLAVVAEINKPARIFEHAVSSIISKVSSGVIINFLKAFLKALVGKSNEVSFLQARDMCGCLAKSVAKSCFDDMGRVDVARVAVFRDLLAKAENFRKNPYSNFPCFEYTRFQMLRVLGHLLNSSEFRGTLEEANKTPLGDYGKTMQHVMSSGMRVATPAEERMAMNAAELILASLLSPHRQNGDLPTCTINSWMNWAILNRPWILARMYASAIVNGSFHTPSGYSIQLTQITAQPPRTITQPLPTTNWHITVDLEHGGDGRASVFRNIASRGWISWTNCVGWIINWIRASEQKKKWRNEGIGYNPRVSESQLNMLVFNLNDVCFAGIFEATFGNGRVNNDAAYGTTYVLNGFPLGTGNSRFFRKFFIETPNDIPNAVVGLQQFAQGQRDKYMRVAYKRRPHGSHAFNVNTDELLALKLDTMKDGEIRAFGDLNWVDSSNADIVRLAIRKTKGGFQLGEAEFAESRCFKTKFEPMDFTRLGVYKTEIMQLPQPMAEPNSAATFPRQLLQPTAKPKSTTRDDPTHDNAALVTSDGWGIHEETSTVS